MKRPPPKKVPKRPVAPNSGFGQGIEQFNRGQFFEAHESWEEIWLRSAEPEKTFLQGLIQLAAAFHHRNRGNPRGARSLLRAGLSRLDPFPARYKGIALENLRQAARRWQALLDQDPGPELQAPASPPLPKIRTIPARSAVSRPSPRGKRGRH